MFVLVKDNVYGPIPGRETRATDKLVFTTRSVGGYGIFGSSAGDALDDGF